MNTPDRTISIILSKLEASIERKHHKVFVHYYAGQLRLWLRRYPAIMPEWKRFPQAQTFFSQEHRHG